MADPERYVKIMRSIQLSIILLLFSLACHANECELEAQKTSENTIIEELKIANYCETDNDCVNIKPMCPFGCQVVVNKAERERVEDLMSEHFEKHVECPSCIYECIAIKAIRCKNRKCLAD